MNVTLLKACVVGVVIAASQSVYAKNKRCGLGSRLFGGSKGIASQTFENITNRASSGGSSITSGTSGCKHNGTFFFEPIGKIEEEQKFYVDASLEELMVDLAAGSGEMVNGLFVLLGCDDAGRSRFAEILRADYDALTKDADHTPELLLKRIKGRLAVDSVLFRSCAAPIG